MEEEFRELEIRGMIYKVSNTGRIFGKRGELKQRLNECGYLEVTVGKTNNRTSARVHRLVIMAFRPCEGMENLEVNHLDYNRTNNNLDNLEWTTHIDNVHYSSDKGNYKGRFKGENNPKAHFTEEQVRTIRAMYESGWKISQIVYELYGVTHSSNHSEYTRTHGWISDIVKYKTWKHIA